jgi:hypothetical protein
MYSIAPGARYERDIEDPATDPNGETPAQKFLILENAYLRARSVLGIASVNPIDLPKPPRAELSYPRGFLRLPANILSPFPLAGINSSDNKLPEEAEEEEGEGETEKE